jgi:hypothetical protein
MPNWNQNSATFRHEDPAQIDRIVDGYNNSRLFGEFIPCPPELLESVEIGENYNERVAAKNAENMAKHRYSDWYDWSITHWGTKWDVGEEADMLDRRDPNTVQISFDTAWSPPVAFYKALTGMGFDMTAYYLEEGMGFVGKYTSEEGDEYFNFDGSEDLEDIPDDIRQFWDLDTICEWRDDEDDDDNDEDDNDGDDAGADEDAESDDGEATTGEKS